MLSAAPMCLLHFLTYHSSHTPAVFPTSVTTMAPRIRLLARPAACAHLQTAIGKSSPRAIGSEPGRARDQSKAVSCQDRLRDQNDQKAFRGTNTLRLSGRIDRSQAGALGAVAVCRTEGLGCRIASKKGAHMWVPNSADRHAHCRSTTSLV
jgi:hypothetical protein